MNYHEDTPQMREAVKRQHEVAEFCALLWGLDILGTPDDGRAFVDVLWGRDKVLKTVVEIRSRNLTLDTLRGFGSYLVTEDKMPHGEQLGEWLGVPFALVVGLYPRPGLDVKPSHVVWWEIWRPDAGRLVEWDARRTLTQRHCEGGLAERVNAFLPLERMGVVVCP